ncbi:hypothetical protein XENTR_v10006984 [Xenopus tropicalis]|nr:hypothetical protein XENTR_v10006984 [Xenopus tropicalis]
MTSMSYSTDSLDTVGYKQWPIIPITSAFLRRHLHAVVMGFSSEINLPACLGNLQNSRICLAQWSLAKRKQSVDNKIQVKDRCITRT